jgi:hypothetical protein
MAELVIEQQTLSKNMGPLMCRAPQRAGNADRAMATELRLSAFCMRLLARDITAEGVNIRQPFRTSGSKNGREFPLD